MEVEVQVEELESGETSLSVEVPAGVVQETKDRVMREIAQRITVPGFRKGKAPRSLLTRFLDDERLREEILDRLLPQALDAALEKAEVETLERPNIEDQELTEDGRVTFRVVVTRKPPVKLPEYKGLKVTKPSVVVKDEQVAAEMERLRTRQRRYEATAERPAQAGDLALVDYRLVIEGEERAGAGAEGYPLIIGADTLFPQLDEALPEMQVGETKNVPVSYPEDYSDAELAGKKGEYRITLKELKEEKSPELTDEFAKDVGLSSVEELRATIRQRLEEFSKMMAASELRTRVVREVVDGSEVALPEALVGREVDAAIDRETDRLESQGLSLDQHLQQTGQTFEQWRKSLELEARRDVKEVLVLDAIGSAEKIEVAPEDIDAEVARAAAAQEISSDKARERLMGAEFTRTVNRIFRRKVLDFLVASAEVTEEVPAAGEAEAAAAEATALTAEAAVASKETLAATEE